MAGNTPSGRNASEVLGLVRPNIRGLQPYVGGAQITSYEEWTKLNQNEFPYPPAPGVVAVKDRFNEKGFVSRYPPGDHRELKSKLAPHLDIEPGQISFGNGSDEALQNVALVFLREGDTIAYMRPDYSMWPIYEQLAGASPAIIDLPDDYRLPVGKVAAAGAKLTFFSNPNTPSGALTPVEEVRRLCEELYPNVVVADEAYVDFAEADVLGLVRSGDHPNLIVSRTFSKAYGLAGLRLGYVTGNPDVISRVEAVRLPYNVNPVTYAAGLATLEPDSMAYYKTLIELTKSERNRLRGNLESLGFRVRPSQTNFVLAKTESPETARTLYGELLKNKILVRYFSDPRLADCLRITVGMPEENDRLIAKIGELLG